MSYKINKKGIQLQEGFGAVLTLVLVAVLIIVGIVLFVNLQASLPPVSASIINETGDISTTGHLLTNSTDCNFASPSITQALTSGGSLIPSANYTLVSNTIVNSTATAYSNALISYSYTNGGSACTATVGMITNFSSYPTLVGLIGTIIFLGLVIGILVASFVFGGKGGA